MAFKIKDLMIDIARSRAGTNTQGPNCDALKPDVACGDKSDRPDPIRNDALFGCPGRHTDIVWCGSLLTYNFGCTGKHTDVDTCPGKHTDMATCPGKHTDMATCPGKHTDMATCPGHHTDIVIGLRRETAIVICVGRHTDMATCPGKHTDMEGCSGKHTDAAWTSDPEEALEELNAIRAQLAAELAHVDGEIRQIEDHLRPSTIEQVEELQTRLREALDELGKIKTDLEKK